MREKLNENPVVQVALVALLAAVAGFLLLSKGGDEEGSGSAEATVAVAGTGASATATGATPGEAVEGAVQGALEAVASEAPVGGVVGAIPPPPIPRAVATAYKANKTVVLLVVDDDGIDDRLVEDSVKRLDTRSDVATFVVPAKQIARYGAITLGVDVKQVPALVVMEPRRFSGGVPQASVDYGFQTARGVFQAVLDASYKGPEGSYHPE